MNENSPEKGGLGACVENVRFAQGFSNAKSALSIGPIKSLGNVTHVGNFFFRCCDWSDWIAWENAWVPAHWRLSN